MSRNDAVIAEKIRTQYVDKSESKAEMLKRMDAKVKKPVNIAGYSLGVVSALIMGSGMSLIMTDLGEKINISNSREVGIVIGIMGMLFALVNVPFSKRLLKSRKEKYRVQILSVADQLVQE